MAVTGEGSEDSVLITGSSSGIGLETAVYLAERGFQVYATMRDPRRSNRLHAEAARRGVEVEVLQLDVTNQGSIRDAVRAVVDQAGEIYALVNNAGIQLRGYFEDLSDAEIRHVFETNVFGTMAVTRAVLPHMRAARRGRILIVTSVSGRIGSIALSAYSSSKFSLEGFGEALSLEMAPLGIEVSLVEPAVIATEIWDSNRRIAEGARNSGSPYHTWFRESERLADRVVRSAPTKPVDVARAVCEALTAGSPRLRYAVGRRANLLLTLRRYLPSALFRRLYFGEVLRRVTKAD